MIVIIKNHVLVHIGQYLASTALLKTLIPLICVPASVATPEDIAIANHIAPFVEDGSAAVMAMVGMTY